MSRRRRTLRRHEYGTDSTGSRAHWYQTAPSRRRAIERAHELVRHAGDTATVYRRPVGRYSVGYSEPVLAVRVEIDERGAECIREYPY